ncbi:MAG: glutamate racemase [Treponema sp.]|nr:glutamate racemase [Treponema sp.]
MQVACAFLDSGTGGIPYMLHFRNCTKNINCIYLADSKNFPYGEKSKEEIIECASSSIQSILNNWDVSAIVIACNTISVTALDSLRERFPNVPIVGTVPAIKLASEISPSRRIGLLATRATVNSSYSIRLQKEFANDCQIFSRADPALVSFIEKKLFSSTESEKERAVKEAVDFFVQNKCDTVILGCTHFIHLSETIQKVAGNHFKVIDSREGVTKQALKMVNLKQGQAGPKNCEENEGLSHCTLYVTGCRESDEQYKTLCKKFDITWGGAL